MPGFVPPTRSRFMTHTLQSLPRGDEVCRVLDTALQAADPAAAVLRFLSRNGDQLTAGGQTYNLADIRHVFLVGAGKAGAPMAQAAAQILDDRLTGGAVIVKDGYGLDEVNFPASLKIIEAGHPLPDERGVVATRKILSLLSQADQSDLVLCLLSGGASALLTAPAIGITLTDLQQTISLLLRSGADIGEINAVRKHLDVVKGGGLARVAAPARVISFILSDVVGDPLDIIASGPTAPDPTTFDQALAVLHKYQLLEQLPQAIRLHLQHGVAGAAPETLKPGDPLLEGVQNLLVGSNAMAAQAAADAAAAGGFNTRVLTTTLQGEARLVGRLLAAAARDLAGGQSVLQRPACLIAGGETTVTVRGDGIGGRNQELALAAVEAMSGLPGTLLVTLATDGGDGPTDAAGAVVSGETLARARALGLSPAEHLTRNDAYRFFDGLGDLLKPGPTHTNVNDLALLFAF
ncbi:MAG: glycerate kinase [Chloroflexi bacterium GWB2_54_36]|nr:MAG: glycerate kinase [Chloroflexi bacterium GWB2_54_36]